jgi:hypothetical protein
MRVLSLGKREHFRCRAFGIGAFLRPKRLAGQPGRYRQKLMRKHGHTISRMSRWPRWAASAAALALGALSLLIARAAPGDLDPSFGSGGKVITDFDGRYDVARALAILPSGKIIAAGEKNAFESSSDFAAARYHPDGSLDACAGRKEHPFQTLAQFFHFMVE